MRRILNTVLVCGLTSCLSAACGEAPSATEGSAAHRARKPGSEPGAKAAASDANADSPTVEKNLPTAEDLFAAHIEAIGGKDGIAHFKTLYFESSIDTGAQNIRASAKTWWKTGHFYAEQDIPGFGVAKSGYDGNVVWLEDPINGLRALQGKEAEQIIREGSIFLVSDWRSHFTAAETVHQRVVEGRTLYDVELTSTLGDKVTMSFAEDDKRLARMSFEQITPTGTVPVVAVFSDYGDVDGAKFAHKSTLEMALGTVSQTYDKIEVNGEVDESRFAFPGSASAVPADPGSAEEAPATHDG